MSLFDDIFGNPDQCNSPYTRQSMIRCKGQADPRCRGGNCTAHCREHCGDACLGPKVRDKTPAKDGPAPPKAPGRGR